MPILTGPWKALIHPPPIVSPALSPIGTPTVIASGDSNSGSVSSVPITGNTVAAGKTLVVVCVGQDPSVQSISDDAGLTWSSLAMIQPASGPVINHRVFVCYNSLATSSGNTITVSLTTNRRVAWLFFSIDMGGGTPALDFQRPVTIGPGGGNVTDTTPTLATADEFVFLPVAVQSAANGSGVTMPSGFTDFIANTGIGSGASNPRLHVGWKIVNSTAAITIDPVLSDNSKSHEFAAVALRR